jgi:hypothetical protein
MEIAATGDRDCAVNIGASDCAPLVMVAQSARLPDGDMRPVPDLLMAERGLAVGRAVAFSTGHPGA